MSNSNNNNAQHIARNIVASFIMSSSSNDVDFLTAIGIVPLSIAEYRKIDELCVYLESKFRTSPLDTTIDDVDYMRQLENRVNNLSPKSDRPSPTLADGPDEWRVWVTSKSKIEQAAIDTAAREIGLLTLVQPIVQADDADVMPPVESKAVESISPDVAFKNDIIRETDSMVSSRNELRRSLATFIKSCDQFYLFDSNNHRHNDASADDIIAAAKALLEK